MRQLFYVIALSSALVGACTKYETPVAGPEIAASNISGGHPIALQARLLTFKNTIGPLRVTGGETDTSVNFRMGMQVTNPAGPAPTTQLSAIQLVVDLRSDTLHFFVNYPRNEPRYRYAAESTFLTPYRFACLVDSVQGLATVSDVGAFLTVRNVRGAKVMRHAGSCTIASLGGAVSAEVTLSANDSCIITAASGDITLKIPPSTSARVTAGTSGGTVSTTGLAFQNLSQQQTNLSGQLGSGSGRIRLQTGLGNISIQAWQR